MNIDWRQVGDKPADLAFAELKQNHELYQRLLQCRTNAELGQFANDKSSFGKLVLALHTADFCAITDLKSALFFEKNARSILAILGLYSLPYCYAGARGARVLLISERLKNHADKRLLETAQFVFDVCAHNAFLDTGKGKLAILKVRIMHAAARYYASKEITDEVPVNQEDLLGTLLSFSLLVLRGLKLLGQKISAIESENYLRRWNYIGELLGIQKSIMPATLRAASIAERSIRRKEFRFSEAGQSLTQALIGAFYQNRGIPATVDVGALMGLFLGEEVSVCLGLGGKNTLKSQIALQSLKLQQFVTSITKDGFKDLIFEFEQLLSERQIKPNFSISLKES